MCALQKILCVLNFDVYLFSCIILCVILLVSFMQSEGKFLLFTDNKDSVLSITLLYNSHSWVQLYFMLFLHHAVNITENTVTQ